MPTLFALEQRDQIPLEREIKSLMPSQSLFTLTRQVAHGMQRSMWA